MHNTWENYEALSELGVKGLKKIDNYVKQFVLLDQEIRNDPLTSREDIEAMDLEKERRVDQYKEFQTVERIVSSRRAEVSSDMDDDEDEGNMNGRLEYFVKWKRLYYDECTWENAEEIASIAPDEVDAFQSRMSSKILPGYSTVYGAHRPPFEKLEEQPYFVKGGELRDFQLTGLNWMAFLWSRNENGILADEMGLGKTVQTVAFLSWLVYARKQHGPFLIVVPLSTINAWQETFDLWAPDLNYIVYLGNNAARQTIRENEFYVATKSSYKPKFNVLLTTYEYILRDKNDLGTIKWQYMAVDEAHRLKNAESALYEALRDFKVGNRLLITGTPLQNNIRELAALIDFLMPGRLSIDQEIDFEQMDEVQEAYIRDLHSQLQPFILRRLKKDVEKSLPSKSEKILRVEMSDMQAEYYRNIITKNYSALNSGPNGAQTSLLNVMVELKKASNHPYLFPGAEDKYSSFNTNDQISEREKVLRGLIMNSGKMVLLDKLLAKLRKDGHRVLIFSQMVRMLDILGDYLSIRGLPFQRLDGTVPSATRRAAIDHFNSPDSPDFVFLLSTRAGGLGINLMTADTVIIFDSDWNPQADLQAMARAHRIGQKKHVMVYRFVSKDTVEEQVLERARQKMILEYAIISLGITDRVNDASRKSREPSAAELSEILKFGAAKMFDKGPDHQKKLEDMNLDDVLDRAEEHVTTAEIKGEVSQLGGEEFLKQFEVTDYKADVSWDDIIPKEELEKIKVDEQKRKEEEFLKQQLEMYSRRRAKAANPNNLYDSSEVDDDDEDAKNRKKKAKNKAAAASARAIAGASSAPLSEKEIRAIIRAILRYGDITATQTWDRLAAEGTIPNRSPKLVRIAYDDIMEQSARVIEAETVKREKEREQQSKDSPAVNTPDPQSSASTSAANKKAILFEFRGVKNVNAELMIQRPKDMKILHETIPMSAGEVRKRGYDLSKFVKLKAVHQWSCDWTARDDLMLLVGVNKYGYGAWQLIRDDPTLGLGSKVYLSDDPKVKKDKSVAAKPAANESNGQEATTAPETASNNETENPESKAEAGKNGDSSSKKAKVPGAIHLGRRVDYLFVTIAAAKQTGQWQSDARASTPGHGTDSPITSAISRSQLHKNQKERTATPQSGSRPNAKQAHRTPKLPAKPSSKLTTRVLTPQANTVAAEELDQYESMDEADCKNELHPIRHSLKRLKKGSTGLDKVQFSAMLKTELFAVGDFIEKCVEKLPAAQQNKRRKHLWAFAGYFWPAKVASAKIRAMYDKKRAERSQPGADGKN